LGGRAIASTGERQTVVALAEETRKAGASRPGIVTARDFDSTRARLVALLVERDLVPDSLDPTVS
jgi:hypothetical protein